jgi:hypothetical protein
VIKDQTMCDARTAARVRCRTDGRALQRQSRSSRETGSQTRFSTASFRGLSYFVMFRPPSLRVSQIVPTAAVIAASQDAFVRADHASLPWHASDILSAPLRQLAERGLSPSQDSQPCRQLTFALSFPVIEPFSARCEGVPDRSRSPQWRR